MPKPPAHKELTLELIGFGDGDQVATIISLRNRLSDLKNIIYWHRGSTKQKIELIYSECQKSQS